MKTKYLKDISLILSLFALTVIGDNLLGSPTLYAAGTTPNQFAIKSDSKSSIVNIFCNIRDGVNDKSISSSGILISNSGLILTNAHVAIHPVLDSYTDKPIDCELRTGEQASSPQPLSVVYISPSWTKRHQGEIYGNLQPDSGEDDFALLKINPVGNNGNIKKIPLRDQSSASASAKILGNTNKLEIGQQIEITGYPLPPSAYYPIKQSETLSITSLFSFKQNEPKTKRDLIETSISQVGKRGASGGAIVDKQKFLVGLVANIVPANESDTENTKVHALTLDHIKTSLKRDTGLDFYQVIKGDGKALKQIFETHYLPQVLEDLK